MPPYKKRGLSERADYTRRGFLKSVTGLSAGLVLNKALGVPRQAVMRESRAILDEGLHWITVEGAERVCKRISRAGFNVFIPCVWHGRGTSWPSSLAPWDDRLSRKKHKNAIENLLHVASTYNIEVHPWFTIGLRQRDFLPEFSKSPKSESFDFHNAKFREFIVSLVLEFLRQYPVQGINLDFVRFNSPRPGHEEEQERAVREVVMRISDGARQINPGIVVSVDAAPWHPEMKQFGQDSVKWADEGLVDVVYSMQYHFQPDFAIIQKFKLSMKRPEALVVVVGNFDREVNPAKVVPRDAKHLNSLIEQARMISQGNGVALYYYGMLNDDQIDILKNNAFNSHAVPSWKRANQDPQMDTFR